METKEQALISPDKAKVTPENKVNAATIVWLIASIIYTVSPIDLIPDVPVVGWIDDMGILIPAVLNLLQNVLPGALGTFCKTLKWILIVLFGILVVLIVLAVSGIMALFK